MDLEEAIKQRRQLLAQQMQQDAIDNYARQKEAIDNKYNTGQTGLSGLLSNLTRDVKAVGNTLATTGAAIASPFVQNYTKTRIEGEQSDSLKRMDAIAQKYGYKNKDDAYEKGDGPEEMWKEFQDSANNTRKAVEQVSSDFKNNAITKKINDTKQSQYGADAIRTLIVGSQAAGLGLNPLGGAVQGALGGVADSLESSDGTVFDLEADLSGGKIKSTKNADIDLGDMAKRAGVGAAVGAATSGIGSKLGNAKSVVGSKLLNNRLATSAVGRGAIAGGVGGALGGGINAALEGGDVLGSAIQGAGSGAITGGVTSGITSGVRKAGTKVTDKLGLTDKINAARQKLMVTPNEKQVATAEQVTDTDMTTQPTEKDFASRTKKDNVAETLKRTGKYLEGMQAALNKSDKKAIGVKDTGKFIDGVRRKTGLDRVPEQAEFAKYITGGENSILDTVQKNALAYDANGKPFYVDTSEIYGGIPEVMKNAKITASSLGGGKKKTEFIKELQNDMFDYDGDLLGLASSWHDAAATYRKSQTSTAKQKAKVYETMARKIEDASYNKIPQENVDAMFDAATMQLRELSNTATNPKVKKAAEQAALSLENTPHTIEDFRHYKEDFVKVNKINDKVLENENGGAVRQARSFRGTANAVKDAVIEKPAYWVANKIGVGLVNAGDRLNNMPNNTGNVIQAQPISADMQNMYNILGLNIGRNEANNAANTAIKNREYRTLEEQLGQTINNAQTYSNEQPQAQSVTMNGGVAMQTNTPEYQLTNIANAMNSALAAGDIQAYSQLANLYKTAYDIYKTQAQLSGASTGASTTKLSEAQQKANAAASNLTQLESMSPDFGYAVRDIPLLNVVNLGGNKYASTADSLASQLGYLLSGATIKDDELQKIKDEYVPQPWDSEEVRKYKLSRARAVIEQYQNNMANA